MVIYKINLVYIWPVLIRAGIFGVFFPLNSVVPNIFNIFIRCKMFNKIKRVCYLFVFLFLYMFMVCYIMYYRVLGIYLVILSSQLDMLTFEFHL